MRFPSMWYVRPSKPQISLYAQSDQSLCLLLPEHLLEFLHLKGGCAGSSESTDVKITHCWKPLVTAHM